jgi:hypothetical protein
MKKEYTINGRKYYQVPLVIGQMARLLTELKGISIGSMNATGLVLGLGADLPRLLACVLVPDGSYPRDVDIMAMEAELWDMEIDQALVVVADFLEQERLGSRLDRITAIIQTQTKPLPGTMPSV